MKAIQLTGGKVAIVDDEDFEELNRYKWHYCEGYAIRADYSGGKRQVIRMHRVVTSAPPNFLVDHINGEGIDNRRSNLRLCTHGENQMNRDRPKSSTSGYSGVNYHRASGKWQCRVQSNGKRHDLGLFDNKHDAARMYNFWCVDLHGKFARPNKIKEDEGER